MNTNQKKVLSYYKDIGSKLGYKYITGETKHFGYYPGSSKTITETSAQKFMMDQVAKNLILKPDQKVLDAGCGYGTTSCYLAKNYKSKVTGIDINEYEIKKSIQRARRENVLDKTNFLVMDYTKLKFPKEYFDKIFTLETLSHSPDLEKTLKGFHKVLKTGGRIALVEYTLAPKNEFSPRELRMINIIIKGTAALGLNKFEHDKFPLMLKSAGFKNIKEENISENVIPSIRRLKNIAALPYFFIKLLGLQERFVNTTLAVEWYKMVKKGLIRHCIFTAGK